ncbi:transcriptional regulator [Streptomyces sp. NPDC001985]|uniref:transcriptional regulator n=1 Tax=Streptomyces sp. NPDC001985 TaxID=3154406 RepID=UPI00332C1D32
MAEGRFTHHGRGRKAELRATADTRRTLAPHADFLRPAFQRDAGLAPWDGVWHLAAFAVPASARTARDALRQTLVHLGGTPLQGGLYVCANAREPYAEQAAHRLGAHGALTLLTTTDLRRGDARRPAELARRLWPLREIADRYHLLSRVARPRLARLTGPAGLSPSERLTIAVEPAAELTRAMEPDPLPPPRLLPRPWPPAPRPGNSSPGAGPPCTHTTGTSHARPSSASAPASPGRRRTGPRAENGPDGAGHSRWARAAPAAERARARLAPDRPADPAGPTGAGAGAGLRRRERGLMAPVRGRPAMDSGTARCTGRG